MPSQTAKHQREGVMLNIAGHQEKVGELLMLFATLRQECPEVTPEEITRTHAQLQAIVELGHLADCELEQLQQTCPHTGIQTLSYESGIVTLVPQGEGWRPKWVIDKCSQCGLSRNLRHSTEQPPLD